MTMKSLIIKSLTLTCALLFSHFIFAQPNDTKEVLYHCPDLNDIKFGLSWYEATPTYNGKHTYWRSQSYYPRPEKILKFVKARLIRDRHHENNNNVFCDYMSEEDSHITMDMPFYGEVVTRTGGGNWGNDICTAASPEPCEFYVASRI